MVSTACPIDSKDFSAQRPSMLHSFSIASHESKTRSLQRCPSGLSHGLQMDLQQAVQLEKQELEKMGLLARPMDVEMALATMMPSGDESNEEHVCSSPPYWLFGQHQTAPSFSRGDYGDCLPCSPPVPIPQHPSELRDDNLPYSIDGDQVKVTGTSPGGVPLCDKFWNYSLSSFESVDAATGFWNRDEELRARTRGEDHLIDRKAGMGQRKHSRPQLPLSLTADSVNGDEEEEDFDDSNDTEEDEHVYHYGDVFEMEDL